MLEKSISLILILLLISCASNKKNDSSGKCVSSPEVQLNSVFTLIENQYIFNAPFDEVALKTLQRYTEKYTRCKSKVDEIGNIKILNKENEKVFLLSGISQSSFVSQLIQSQAFFESVTEPEYLLNGETVTDLLLNSIALSLKDTVYYSNNDTNKLNISFSVKQASIGINLIRKDGNISISTVLYDSPAYRSGLRSGYIIYKINDQEVKDLTLMKAADLMDGEYDTLVKLSVKHSGAVKDFQIKRDFINYKFISKIIENNILYIQIPRLEKDIKSEIMKYNGKVSGLIFDLRGCPGGDMYDIVSICESFVPQKDVIVFLKRKKSGERSYISTTDKQFKKIPIVILIDSSTSSGAELFARCLKYYSNAIIIGEKSFGTGIVYSFFSLCSNSYLKMPMAEMLSPDKVPVSSGIVPDVFVDDQTIIKEAVNYITKQI